MATPISKSRTAIITVALVSTVFCAGCLPRGETTTLANVYEKARNQYNTIGLSSVTPQIKQQLESLNSHLDALSAGAQSGAFTEHTQSAADLLADLTNHAGYPSRPALGELAARYRELAAANVISSSGLSAQPQVKLLMARTYNLLSSELEAAKFKIQ